MSGFYDALRHVLEIEGGYVDDPDDRGGATNRGITQGVYDQWRMAHDRPTQSVERLTWDEVHAIYHRNYWVAGRCDALRWPVSLAHFDGCVNHGVGGAIKLLQRAVGVTDDGVWGPVTQAAIEDMEDELIVLRLLMERIKKYVAIANHNTTQRKFLRGWLKRVIALMP